MTLKHVTACLFAVALMGCAQTDAPFSNPSNDGAFSGVGSAVPPEGAVDSTSLTGGSVQDPSSPAFFVAQGDRVLFAVDQSSVSAEARVILDRQAAFMMQNTNYTAVIEGHADEQGTRAYNLALGARRAAAVRDYLVAKGVASSRLRTVSFGKERPLEVCSSESCYAKNRRAVTALSGAGGV